MRLEQRHSCSTMMASWGESLSKKHATMEVRNMTRSHEAGTKVRAFVNTQPVFIGLARTVLVARGSAPPVQACLQIIGAESTAVDRKKEHTT